MEDRKIPKALYVEVKQAEANLKASLVYNICKVMFGLSKTMIILKISQHFLTSKLTLTNF